MNAKKILFLGAFLLSFLLQDSFAEPLPLTDHQIQKLQSLFSTSGSEEVESPHLTWKGDPISVNLPLNQEKRLIFPDHVSVDVKGQLTTDQLRLINNDQSLYFTALKSFANTRIYITLQSTGKVILLDLATNDQANNQTETIDVMQDNTHVNSKPSSDSIVTTSWMNNHSFNSDNTNPHPMANYDGDIHLIRYAWRQLFAPENLIPIDSDMSRIPMHASFFVSNLVYGDKVWAHPISEWQNNNEYITAILLRNKYPHPTYIHIPQDLCGEWQAATLYPRHDLKPAGVRNGDSTTLLVISKQPFMQSIEVCNGMA